MKSKRWVCGEIVEAFDGCRWSIGKIAKVLKNDQFVIKLFGSIQLKQFHESDLRIRKASLDRNLSTIREVAKIKRTSTSIQLTHDDSLARGQSRKKQRAIANRLNAYPRPLWSADDNDQSSVASCSSNEFAVYPCGKFMNSLDRVFDSSDAESLVPSTDTTCCELEADLHRLELHAYKSTIQALCASGPLSWEQESLLTNLRLSLHISDDEHLLHLRHLLSAQVL